MAQKSSIEPRLLDRAKAAQYCGVSVQHFLACCPVPHFEGFGAKKLWDRQAIDRWVDGGAAPSEARPTIEELLDRA